MARQKNMFLMPGNHWNLPMIQENIAENATSSE